MTIYFLKVLLWFKTTNYVTLCIQENLHSLVEEIYNFMPFNSHF